MRDWLREIRSSTSQEAVGELVGIGQSAYSLIESGFRRPSPEVAKKIAVALNFEKYGLDWTKFFEEDKPTST